MTAIELPGTPDPSTIISAVDEILYTFLDNEERRSPAPELVLFIDLLREFIAAGGKRIRPILCLAGWSAVSESRPPPIIFRMAASLELFHVFALIHDDIMDNSASRRGRPSAQRTIAAHYPDHPESRALGVNAAILLGDIALGWSYDLLLADAAVPDQPNVPWSLLNTMRAETLAGQFLDLVNTGSAGDNVDTAWRITRLKTAKYTFERPLHLGATLAGATRAQLEALSAYALPIGEAFQLRDDIVGMFGDPLLTGKPDIDDLREGKRTVLITTAFQRATPTQRRGLRASLGNPCLSLEEAEKSRDILRMTGAVDTVESLIAERYRSAIESLVAAPIRAAAADVLRQVATAATADTIVFSEKH